MSQEISQATVLKSKIRKTDAHNIKLYSITYFDD